MKTTVRTTILLLLLTAGGACAAGCQLIQHHRVFPQVLLSSPSVTLPESPATSEVVREIDDPHTGDRWLLTRDPSRPGGPGRMILAKVGLDLADQHGPEGSSALPEPPKFFPVIHTGDHLVVEENTRVADVVMDATALGPALLGSPLHVRLSIGGSVVRAVALGPGRAVFATETGSRP